MPGEDVNIFPYGAIRSAFSSRERVSLIYIGFGLASSPIFTWSKESSVGGSRCSKRMSHSMFRCLIQGSSSVFISSISSSSGSGWADHVDRDRLEECAYANIGIERRGVGGVVVPGQRIGVHVRLVRHKAIPQSSVVLKAARAANLQWCPPSLAVVQSFFVFETIPPSFHYTGNFRGES